jgi:chlorite dismutase
MTEEQDVKEARFLKYTFFKAARDWRSLDRASKEAASKEFLDALDDKDLHSSFFSLVGIRGDADFMVLMESPNVDAFQPAVSRLLATGLGRHLDIPYSYLAMTKRSRYLGSHSHPGQEGEGGSGWTSSKYLFVYPFVKKREWYRLPFAERQRMMADHFRVGHKYPKIKIHTGYSFGLDDQEFVLAFEGDEPSEFLALVEELRGTEASMYTQLETPTFTCRRVDPSTMVSLLG